MRWILLILAIASFALVFTTKSPGLLGFGLAVGVLCSLGFVISLASARIASTAQPETMLIVDPEVSAMRSRTQKLKLIQSNVAKPGAKSAGTLANRSGNSDRSA